MQSNFTRGLITGAIIGATVSMMVSPEMNTKTKRKLVKGGKNFLRKSGGIVGDLVDIFR